MLPTNGMFTFLGSKFRVGQVNQYYPADSEQNLSKIYPEYDVIMYDGENGQVMMSNVRQLNTFSGFHQSEITILEANVNNDERGVSARNRNGAMVILGFIDSDFNKPFILSSFEHESKIDPLAIEEQGRFTSKSFNGTATTINDAGEITTTFTGRLDDEGVPLVEEQTPMTFKMGIVDNSEELTGHRIVVNGTEGNQRIKILTAQNQQLLIEDTLDAELISLTHKTGSTIVMATDGSISLTEKGGADSITIAEGLITLKTPEYKIEADTFLAEAGGSSIKVDSSGVALGNSSAELLDLVDQSLGAFIDNASSLVLTSVGPGQLSPAVVALLTNIKTLLGQIKGSL